MEKGLSFNGGNSKTWRGQQSDNYQWASRGSIVDNQTGSYRRATLKESLSTGDVFKERSTGRLVTRVAILSTKGKKGFVRLITVAATKVSDRAAASLPPIYGVGYFVSYSMSK
uniref:Uncharacterized protein n=1 Tax=Manihot esculenta TaxID=3983 RepID=A0A2C9VNS2_MANES